MRSPQAIPPGWLQERLGVRLLDASPVAGGSIHSSWCLQVEGAGPERLFAKTNRADRLPLLQAEADGLAALAGAAAGTGLGVPGPLALGTVAGRAVLVLPWLERSAPSAGDWRTLGEGLAALHRHSVERVCADGDRPGSFGWGSDNWIGSAPQANGWCDHWGEFFTQRRLAPQAARLKRRGVSLPGLEELLGRLPERLAEHRPTPCLVHGDLWSGNVMAALRTGPGGAGTHPTASMHTATGGGALFDPAVYRGDREVDLAMAQLFGGFPAEFFAGYQQTWALDEGHRQRMDLYNLYHLLNHANLFGGGYLAQAAEQVDACLHSAAEKHDW